ncbi:MAG: hypothetical protein Hyperionvirus1_114 [Hyperionvirus sp.]|uniref:SnoaL-like domain-containing protein n=1 Tax=Hyperionvirus sp. TaxID=2487770 RepID=A0A3G5A5K7_9VIRU|nr:MAG: hypothetical protein Hyperionvirus1_114 [Hyperionvirus sp.]
MVIRAAASAVLPVKPAVALKAYFEAVNAQCDRERKVERISDTFADDTEIVSQNGQRWRGRDGVKRFYYPRRRPCVNLAFVLFRAMKR